MLSNQPPQASAIKKARRSSHTSRVQLGEGTTFLPGPQDPSVADHISHILQHGYTILPSLFPPSLISSALTALSHLESLSTSGPASHGGRNPFEGYSTNRVYALADKSRVFDPFAINPTVLKLNDYFLQEGYLLTSFHTVTIGPGEREQSMHTDDGLIDLPRPRPLMGIVRPSNLNLYLSFTLGIGIGFG
jgi:hypothetical protein